MSATTRIGYVPHFEGSRDNALCLIVPIWQMLDHFPIEARRELVSWAMADGELLKVLCNQIASANDSDADCGGYPAADCWIASRDRTALREALLPLMPEAIADELREAREIATKNERGASSLRSLIHVSLMMRREGGVNRDEQYLDEWRAVRRWYKSVNGALCEQINEDGNVS